MIFQVKALTVGGDVVLLRIEAPAEADARREVESRGLSVFMAQPVKSVGAMRFGSRAVKVNALAFSQELLMLLRAGLSLVGSLEAMAEKELHVGTRAVVDALLLDPLPDTSKNPLIVHETRFRLLCHIRHLPLPVLLHQLDRLVDHLHVHLEQSRYIPRLVALAYQLDHSRFLLKELDVTFG